MCRVFLVAALVIALAAAAPTPSVVVTSIANNTLSNDYQSCFYMYSIIGSNGGNDIAFAPFVYNNNGVPCIPGYGDWTNVLSTWSAGNASEADETGIESVWTTKGSQWPLLFPRNHTILFPFNWALYTQPASSSVLSPGMWGINNMPYSSYDTDNYAIAVNDSMLFYTYTYRVGQGYTLYVSIVALNSRTDVAVNGFYYQGEADNGGYPAGGITTLNSSFPGHSNTTGGVAVVFITQEGNLTVSTLNDTWTVYGALPLNISAVYNIAASPHRPDREVLVLLTYTPTAADIAAGHVLDDVSLTRKLREVPSHDAKAVKGAHVDAVLRYEARTGMAAAQITKVLRIDVVTGKVLAEAVVPDATSLTVGWRDVVGVTSPTAITLLNAASLKVVGGAPLSKMDYYGPYVPYSSSFGTGYAKDASAVLYFLGNGRDGIGFSAAKLKASAA